MTVGFHDQYAEHERRRTAYRALVQPAAVLSVGAALVHALVVRHHAAEGLLSGAAMAAFATLQVTWPLLVWRLGRAVVAPGIVLHAGIAVLWALAVTVGLPGVGHEEVGPLGVGATLMEAVVVLLAAAALRPDGLLRPVTAVMVRDGVRELAVPFALGVCLATLSFAAGGSHGH